VSTRTLTRRGSPGRRSDAPALPSARGAGWYYDRTGERVDEDQAAELAAEFDGHSPDPVRCRYGSIVAVDGTCCWRWPHPL
jgi:hypothetical protein